MPKEIIYIVILIIVIALLSNKTFFYRKYEIGEKTSLFIPRFSFFIKQTDSFAVFFTLKTEKQLKTEFSPNQNDYRLENKKIYRKIYLYAKKEDV